MNAAFDHKELKVGVIGLGAMGSAIAESLISKGYETHVYNRTKEKAAQIRERGAAVHETPRDLGAAVDILITSLTDEKATDKVAQGENGFLFGMKKDTLWIETSTADPDTSISLSNEARQLGINRLEAPIVGNQIMMREQKVTMLVGGDRKLFERYEKFLGDLSNKVVYVGPDGHGLKMKLLINLYLGLVSESFSEVFVLSEKLGFAPSTFVNILNQTPHKNYFSEVKGPKLAIHDFSPLFSMENLLKDLRLAIRQVDETDSVLPVSKLVTQEFAKAVASGEGKKDFSAIAHAIERMNGLTA